MRNKAKKPMTMSAELVGREVTTADVPEEVSELPLAADTGVAPTHMHVHRPMRHLASKARELRGDP